MKKLNSLTPLAAMLALSVGTTVVATEVHAGSTPSAAHEGKCGEAKCGGKKVEEAKCGGKKAEEAKCGSKKADEAKCGAKKAKESSCGANH